MASVHKGENDDVYSDEAFHRRITDKMTDASASLWALLAAFLYSGVESFSVGCRLLVLNVFMLFLIIGLAVD